MYAPMYACMCLCAVWVCMNVYVCSCECLYVCGVYVFACVLSAVETAGAVFNSAVAHNPRKG